PYEIFGIELHPYFGNFLLLGSVSYVGSVFFLSFFSYSSWLLNLKQHGLRMLEKIFVLINDVQLTVVAKLQSVVISCLLRHHHVSGGWTVTASLGDLFVFAYLHAEQSYYSSSGLCAKQSVGQLVDQYSQLSAPHFS
ncbi:MAG TPA: hypothetical protein VGO47_09160, partial [Chlamydiales bacterium]|nr:hypothetical protein [Chlamydiales bacterium]